jgi:hypothetical protein
MAELLQMTPAGVAAIKSSKDYQEYETGVLNGHLTDMDRALAGRVSAIRKEMQIAVPAALRCLVDAVTQRQDLPTALAAAKEILKRDPDRTLSEETAGATSAVPAAVLDAAAEEGNHISQEKNPPKEQVN